MPMRGMEIRAVTAVGGTTAAAAFGWVAGGTVAATVAEGDDAGDAVAGASARRVLDGGGSGAGERQSPVAGSPARRTSPPTASRTRGPLLIELCSQPSAESQSNSAREPRAMAPSRWALAAPREDEARAGNGNQAQQAEHRPGDARGVRWLARRRQDDDDGRLLRVVDRRRRGLGAECDLRIGGGPSSPPGGGPCKGNARRFPRAAPGAAPSAE